MGLLIFFDDYANCMIIGNTMRPLTDRMKISREKLAYIVDSTAAPVATLSIISTWVVAKMGFIVETGVIQDTEIFSVFLKLIPYSFYSLFTLLFVFLIASTRRDFGAMRKAENRALQTGQVIRPGAAPLADSGMEDFSSHGDMSRRWYVAALPVLALVACTLLGLLFTGKAALGEAGATSGIWEIMGNANSYNAILWGAMGGSLLALLLAMLGGHLSPKKSIEAWLGGCKGMFVAILVLTLAWSIAQTCEDLSVGPWVVAQIGNDLPLQWLPAITFVLSALIAFSTGTSWGTMAILIPIIAPLAWVSPEEGIRFASLAGVLSGAIFGDHCSPISDTTVMSSFATASDHIDHVRTQLPYGLLCGGVAIVIGFIPTGFGVPPWASLAVGSVLLLGVLLFFGRKPQNY
jgi:Na+/H+ antiporter NhaC